VVCCGALNDRDRYSILGALRLGNWRLSYWQHAY
jgi:hypothetical protein